MSNQRKHEAGPATALLLLTCLSMTSTPSLAEPGPYIGGSVGGSTLEFEVFDEFNGGFEFIDDDQLAWKLFGGYRFDTEVFDVAVEGGYVNLTDGDFIVVPFGISLTTVDVTGWDVLGVVGVDLGPINLFGKAGLIFWDVEASIISTGTVDDSGTDLAYGAGFRFNLGRMEFRIEYEEFDIDAANDIDLVSAGLVLNF